MNDSIFFDTDCISSILWGDDEGLLEKLYFGKIMIPKEVYDEVNKSNILDLRNKIDRLVTNGSATIISMDIDTEEYALYMDLITGSGAGYKVIGKGEAASISLAKKHNGVLGSNNLKDIKHYVDKFNLKHITSADILAEAFEKNRAAGRRYMVKYVSKEMKNRSNFINKIFSQRIGNFDKI